MSLSFECVYTRVAVSPCVSEGVNVRVLCAAVTIGAKERERKTESVRAYI